MINTAKNTAQWFLKKTDENKVQLVLIAFIVILLYDKNLNIKAQSQQYNEQHVNDSIRDARYNDLSVSYRQAIKDCQEQQQKQFQEFLNKYIFKYEELFKTTDEIYHESKIKEQ